MSGSLHLSTRLCQRCRFTRACTIKLCLVTFAYKILSVNIVCKVAYVNDAEVRLVRLQASENHRQRGVEAATKLRGNVLKKNANVFALPESLVSDANLQRGKVSGINAWNRNSESNCKFNKYLVSSVAKLFTIAIALLLQALLLLFDAPL